VSSIDINPFDNAGQTQFNNRVILATVATPTSLSTIHLFTIVIKLAFDKYGLFWL
jgi:hypothetical protein